MAIANATRQLADSGLQYVDYESGWRNRVDVAVRRAVMTKRDAVQSAIRRSEHGIPQHGVCRGFRTRGSA